MIQMGVRYVDTLYFEKFGSDCFVTKKFVHLTEREFTQIKHETAGGRRLYEYARDVAQGSGQGARRTFGAKT